MNARSLSVEQQQGVARIVDLMASLGISAAEVKRVYVPPKPRVLSEEQKRGIKAIRSIAELHLIELAEIVAAFEKTSDVDGMKRKVGAVGERGAGGALPPGGYAGFEVGPVADKGTGEGVSAGGAGEVDRKVNPNGNEAGSTVAAAPPMRPGDKGYVKYRHPTTGETWDGTGKHPEWLRKALIDDGMYLRDLIPPENAESLEQEGV